MDRYFVRRAAVVAFVKGPDDVTIALKYARENSLPIAIRGGDTVPPPPLPLMAGL